MPIRLRCDKEVPELYAPKPVRRLREDTALGGFHVGGGDQAARHVKVAVIANADHGPAPLFLPVAPFDRRLGQRRRFRVERFKRLGFLVRAFVLPRGLNLRQRLGLFGGQGLRLTRLPSVITESLVGRLAHDLHPRPAFGADRLGLVLEQGGGAQVFLIVGLEQIGDDVTASFRRCVTSNTVTPNRDATSSTRRP